MRRSSRSSGRIVEAAVPGGDAAAVTDRMQYALDAARPIARFEGRCPAPSGDGDGLVPGSGEALAAGPGPEGISGLAAQPNPFRGAAGAKAPGKAMDEVTLPPGRPAVAAGAEGNWLESRGGGHLSAHARRLFDHPQA